MNMPMVLITSLLLFSFGACIGSFLNAVIYRLPRDISFGTSRSHCPKCNKLIYWYENIPIFSYFFLQGRCSGCSGPISFRYPAVEIVTGLAAFLILRGVLDLPEQLPIKLLEFGVFACFLPMTIIDLEFKLLPNVLNLLLALFLLTMGIMSFSLSHILFGALLGFCFPLAITYLFYLVKGQVGLGGGDIKLYGALGLYLGPIQVMQNIFLSCFLGALVGVTLILFKLVDRRTPIPFGPFIIIVASFQIFFSETFHSLVGFLLVHQ